MPLLEANVVVVVVVVVVLAVVNFMTMPDRDVRSAWPVRVQRGKQLPTTGTTTTTTTTTKTTTTTAATTLTTTISTKSHLLIT